MKIIIAVVASIAFFALGLIGMYMAMPALAPDVVEETTARLDSLELARNPPDPMTMPAALTDSLGNVLLDSTAVAPPMADPSLNAAIAALRENTFRKRCITSDIAQTLFSKWSALAQSVPIWRITRPEGRDTQAEIVEIASGLLAQMQRQPAYGGIQ